jgi:hypothetical protein
MAINAVDVMAMASASSFMNARRIDVLPAVLVAVLLCLSDMHQDPCWLSDCSDPGSAGTRVSTIWGHSHLAHLLTSSDVYKLFYMIQIVDLNQQ